MSAPSHNIAGVPGLPSALKSDGAEDGSSATKASLKAVQIAEPPAEPLHEEHHGPHWLKQFRASTSRRLSGKPAPLPRTASMSSVGDVSGGDEGQDSSQHTHRHHHHSDKLLAQVAEWLDREKAKATRHKHRLHRHKNKSSASTDVHKEGSRQRSDSLDSQSSEVSLDRLQRILEDSMSSLQLRPTSSLASKSGRNRQLSMSRRSASHRGISSDTDYVDGDALVPNCDEWLDNTKALSYGGGTVGSTDDLGEESSAKDEKGQEAWSQFKSDILRLAHTLRLKGWRRIPLDNGDSLSVERLSGALTNAVYVVTPPSDLPDSEGKKPPQKLLLRVYGPQAENLIDREVELQVLKRLARKKIGPRMLGTFRNGRFEQFFNAITLTSKNLREPDTIKQIAKRMRELHEGIDLLPHEREGGPTVWKSWDHWQQNVSRIARFLDARLDTTKSFKPGDMSVHGWMAKGYVCGVPWPQFMDVIAKYRSYLQSCYTDQNAVCDRLVFAHNDTQYGNILRIKTDDEKSPLLQAANKHKQLIVIDFEYAAANLPGLEFANHFTEWCYNYHEANASWVCSTRRYPRPEEQYRFLKAYVDHRPQFPHASSTPRMKAHDSNSDSGGQAAGPSGTNPQLVSCASSSSIVEFMLDSRAPPAEWTAAEKKREEDSDRRVKELMDETRLWRPANSLHWVAWGIVQANVTGLEASDTKNEVDTNDFSESLQNAEVKADEDMGADDFDYLKYSQDRAMFFWGDMVELGLVKLEELPETLRTNLKIVDV